MLTDRIQSLKEFLSLPEQLFFFSVEYEFNQFK